MNSKLWVVGLLFLGILGCQEKSNLFDNQTTTYSQTTKIPEGILTPDQVETSIGTLNFTDGAPLPETAELVYDNLVHHNNIKRGHNQGEPLKGLKYKSN